MNIADLEIYFNSRSLPAKLILKYGLCTNVKGAVEALILRVRQSRSYELAVMDIYKLNEFKNAIDNFNEDDYINDPEKYCIKHLPEIKDSLHISYSEYVMLREYIKEKLLAFFEEITYKDAGVHTPYIRFLGIINTRKKYWPYADYMSTNVFYVPEWFKYQKDGDLEDQFNCRLEIIKDQYLHTIKK